MMLSFILFGVFFLFLLIGTPIAVCLGTGSIAAMLYDAAGKPIEAIMTTLPRIVSSSTSKFVLMAIPFFIMSGTIMEKAGISTRLINFAQNFVGHLRGGLIVVCVGVAAFFAAISGSGPATVAALGMILIPAMVNDGYSKTFSSALMTSAGALGVIIPPSITFVVYGSIADTSIGDLFIAGVVPGLIIGVFLIITAFWISRNAEVEIFPKATAKMRWDSFKDAFWGLLMPGIILGGIYGGVFTPTEAACVSVVYGLFVGFFIYRTLKFKDLYDIFVDSVSLTAVIMFITAGASLFAYILTRSRLDLAISQGLIDISGGNYIIFLLIVNVILLIAGCFLDSTSALFIFTPLFVPVAVAMDINLVHFGVVMIVNLAIGMITPPVGANLFVGCGVDLKSMSVAVVPFVLAAIVALMILTYIPAISLLFV
ncbi:TRAP transporter large permease [Selenomonas sp. TAMA-11512]|uniref:TRAP transporter large permease n=1 Tax=Selenomonas sp. TAMA-11512 TaxID=3095337 RepID=UPI0030D2C8E2